jgi:hypothetical protein
MMTGPGRGEFGERAENARRENALNNDRAARTVAGRAADAQDCRLLLEMLGLDTGPRDRKVLSTDDARGPFPH